MLKSLFTKNKIKWLKAKSDRYSRLTKKCISMEEVCIQSKDYKGYWFWCQKCDRYLDKRLRLCKQLLKLRGY